MGLTLIFFFFLELGLELRLELRPELRLGSGVVEAAERAICLTGFITAEVRKNADFKKTRVFQAEINRLMKAAIGSGPRAITASRRAQDLLRLDDANWTYYFALYKRNASRNDGAAPVVQLFEEGIDTAGKTIVYPTSTAPAALLKHLRKHEYVNLAKKSEAYGSAAKNAALWIKKMQAGSGSSLTRTSYLSRKLGIPEAQVRIGAKGTDLLIDVPHPVTGKAVQIPIAEAQILQSILDRKNNVFGSVIFHDILSSETKESIRKMWKKPSLLDPQKSYEELIAGTPGLERFRETMQSHIPTLDEAGQITFEREAPGGHALFAIDALRAAYKPELRPRTPGKALISAISNGEDVGGTPDPIMVGWMMKEQIPIAIVTTEKTSMDVKGGLISLMKAPEGDVSLTIYETAQAKAAGQGKLYEKLQGSASTNLTLFNYDVLAPKIEKLVSEIGEDEFLKIIAPDLILNSKEKFVQLEGAMGSTIMNLDRYWRKHYGQPLVHLVNVDKSNRTRFFSPVKSAFDYYMQFHSDRFKFIPHEMRLKDLKPGELPHVRLSDAATQDKHYQDVQTVLDAFEGASIAELQSLSVDGKIKLTGVVLRGRVEIVNESATVTDLSKLLPKDGRHALIENCRITVRPDGQLIVTPL